MDPMDVIDLTGEADGPLMFGPLFQGIAVNNPLQPEEDPEDEEEEEEGEAEDSEDDTEYDPDDAIYYYDADEAFDRGNSNYTGLSNQGATCYLNSLLQTLFMTPEVRRKLFDWHYDPEVHGSPERSIPLQLQKLFAELQLSMHGAATTTAVTKSFGWEGREVFVQHDVNELCHILFDALDKTFAPNLYRKTTELKRLGDDATEEAVRAICDKYDSLIESQNEEFVSTLYRGEMVDCLLAKDIFDENGEEIGRKRVDPYLDIAVVIRGCDSVEKALENYACPEILDGDNQWSCDQLGRKVDAIKGFRFKSFPPILNVNLKRFDYNPRTWQREKLGHCVSFPMELDVSPYIHEDYRSEEEEENENENTIYELFSVLIHSGTATSGHYYAYIKSFESGKWFEFNDSRVDQITEFQVKKMFGSNSEAFGFRSTNAYMLSYRSKALINTGVTELCDPETIPAYVRDPLMEGNSGILSRAKRIQEMERRVKLRLWEYVPPGSSGKLPSFLMETNVKKTDSIRRVREKIHIRLVKKFPEKFQRGLEGRRLFRLRDYSLKSTGRKYDRIRKRVLKYMNINKIHTFMIETRPSADVDYPRDIKFFRVPIHILLPNSYQFEYSHTARIPTHLPLGELRQMIIEKIRKRILNEFTEIPEFVKPENLEFIVYRPDSLSECLTILGPEFDSHEAEPTIDFEDMMDMLCVELHDGRQDDEEGGGSKRGYQMLYHELYCYDLFYNIPGTDEYDQIITIDSEKKVSELKRIIGERLGLDITGFRMMHKYTTGVRPFRNRHWSLSDVPMVYTGSMIHIEIGAPLKKGQHKFTFFSFRHLAEVLHEEDLERIRKNDQSKTIKPLEADEIAEREKKAAAAASSSVLSISTEMDEEKSTTEEATEGEEEEEDGETTTTTTEGEEGTETETETEAPAPHPNAFELEFEDQGWISDRDLAISRKKDRFTELFSLVVSSKDTLLSVKERVAEQLGNGMTADRVRIWEKRYTQLGKILRFDNLAMSRNVQNLLYSRHYCVQTFPEGEVAETFGAEKMVIFLRQWHPDTFCLDMPVEFVAPQKKRGRAVAVRESVAEFAAASVGVDPSDIEVCSPPYQVDSSNYKHIVAQHDWKAQKIFHTQDGSMVLWRVKSTPDKYDMTLLKRFYPARRIIYYGGIGPTYPKGFWDPVVVNRSASSSSGPSKDTRGGVKIYTEFDSPPPGGAAAVANVFEEALAEDGEEGEEGTVTTDEAEEEEDNAEAEN